jgi:hypothetical protein
MNFMTRGRLDSPRKRRAVAEGVIVDQEPTRLQHPSYMLAAEDYFLQRWAHFKKARLLNDQESARKR